MTSEGTRWARSTWANLPAAQYRNATQVLPDAAQKYGLEQDIVVGRDGLVHVPNGPGLGAAIDFNPGVCRDRPG